MAVKVGELYETLELDTKKFKKDISAAKEDTMKFSKMLGGIGKAAAAGAAAAGTALAGAAAKGVKEFANFDKQMNEVFTLMPKASEKAQQQMSDDLRAFSNEMGVATDEAAPALYQAISAGVPKDNVFTFMEEAQKAATAGVTDLKTSVDVLSSVVNTYGEENISAAEASDLMFTAVKQGKTTFGELSANMSDVAPIASSMGIEFSNITAALSTMTSQGTPTAKATTQLKTAMSELSKQGSKAGTAFREVAGTDFQTFISEGGNLQEAMALMEDAAKENGTTVSNMFGSIEAGQAALALTGEGAKKFKEDLNEMNSSSGATEAAYKKMEESLTRNFERIQVGMNEVWLTVGEQLMPIMKDLTDWVIANMPKIQAVVETVFSAVSDAIYLGIDAYKEIKSFVEGFVSDNSESLNAVMADYQEIFDSIKQIITTFVDWIEKFWSAYGETITNITTKMFDLLKQIFKTKLDVIKGILKSIVKLMQGDFDGFKNEIIKTISELFENITKIISKAWENLLKPIVDNLIEKIVTTFENMKARINEIFTLLIENVTNWFSETGLGKMVTKAKDLTEKTTGFFSGMYNKIVGNSIVPDMVNGVLSEFMRMQGTGTSIMNIFAGGTVGIVDNLKSSVERKVESMVNNVLAEMARLATNKLFGGLFGGIGDLFGGIFHDGGVVPGPIGQERLILAQAGETVSPIGSNTGSGGGGYGTANISVNLDGRTIAKVVKQPLVDDIRIKGGARF